MRGVTGFPADNVVPFRRPAPVPPFGAASLEADRLGPDLGPESSAGGLLDFAARAPAGSGRGDQRRFLDSVYAAGSLPVAAGDRAAKLMASRLQVYGFVTIEEVGPDGSLRRLKASQAIRAPLDRPWRVSKAGFGATRAVSLEASRPARDAAPEGGIEVAIPAVDAFLFEATREAPPPRRASSDALPGRAPGVRALAGGGGMRRDVSSGGSQSAPAT